MKVRQVTSLAYDRETVRTAERAVSARVAAAFPPIGEQCAAALRARAAAVVKADGEDPADIVDRVDMDGLGQADGEDPADIVDRVDMDGLGQADGIAADLKPVVSEVAHTTVVSLGLGTDAGFVDQVNKRAVQAVADQLKPSIAGLPEATRKMLRKKISFGLANGDNLKAIADKIASDYALSPERAELIAATEVSNANSMASLESYKSVAATGVRVLKSWLAAPNCCDICESNAAAGPIELDQPFPSGHACPAGHPKCRCALSPSVVMETEKATLRNSQSIMSDYHRHSAELRVLRADLGKLQKMLDEFNDLSKASGFPPLKTEGHVLANKIAKVDALLAEPMPLPWDLLLANAPPAGSA